MAACRCHNTSGRLWVITCAQPGRRTRHELGAFSPGTESVVRRVYAQTTPNLFFSCAAAPRFSHSLSFAAPCEIVDLSASCTKSILTPPALRILIIWFRYLCAERGGPGCAPHVGPFPKRQRHALSDPGTCSSARRARGRVRQWAACRLECRAVHHSRGHTVHGLSRDPGRARARLNFGSAGRERCIADLGLLRTYCGALRRSVAADLLSRAPLDDDVPIDARDLGEGGRGGARERGDVAEPDAEEAESPDNADIVPGGQEAGASAFGAVQSKSITRAFWPVRALFGPLLANI